MRPLIALLLIAASTADVEVTFSQWNMMLHSPALPRMFPYLPAEFYTHEGRVRDTLRIINEIQADATCFNEWNANEASPYFIDSEAVLLAKFKAAKSKGSEGALAADKELQKILTELNKSLAAAEEKKYFFGLDAVIDKKAKSMWPGASAEAKSFMEELSDRLTTLASVRYVYFYKSPDEFGVKLVPQGTGRMFSGDGTLGPEIVASPTLAPDERRPAMLLVFNRAKFDEVQAGEYKVFLTESENAGEPDPDNYIVKELKLKGTDIRVDLICAQFPAGFDGVYARKRIGRSISQYIRSQREAGSTANFVLLGDLKSDVPEVAYNLAGNVVRFNIQKVLPSNQFKPRTIFVPRSQMRSLEARLDYETARYERFKAYMLRRNRQLKDDENDAQPFIRRINGLRKLYQNVERFPTQLGLPTWVELCNFWTEKKVRMSENNFDDKEYKQYVSSLLSANSDVKSRVDTALNRLQLTRSTFSSVLPFAQFLEEENESRDRRAAEFTELMLALVEKQKNKDWFTSLKDSYVRDKQTKYDEFKRDPKGFSLAKHPIEFFQRLILEELYSTSREDYILVQPYNRFALLEIRSNAAYNTDIKTGIPSKDTPSDSFPSMARVSFGTEKFDYKKYLVGAVESFSFVNNEYENAIIAAGTRKRHVRRLARQNI